MEIEIRRVDWPFAQEFRIASRSQSVAETVEVRISEGGLTGRGEAMGVYYHGETADSIYETLRSFRAEVGRGVTREHLQTLLPPGGARNAVDCALWDLEAKRSGRRAWDLAGLSKIEPLVSAYTLSLDSPRNMREAAAAVPAYPILKLKLGGEGDPERVAEVRAARPDATITVDANQAWNERQLREFVPKLADLGVVLIEQPLPADADEPLASFKSAVPLCADESCQTRASLPRLRGKYRFINIKLDKTGGLTEALALARDAQAEGFELMVGCMAGSSLGMAPAFIVGQLCRVVDLDGPLLAAADVAHPIRYEGSRMFPPDLSLWG